MHKEHFEYSAMYNLKKNVFNFEMNCPLATTSYTFFVHYVAH